MIPVYEKPTTKSRKKRPGAKTGHPGSRRRVPDRIDRRETHKLPCCPDCGGRLKRTGETRTRYVEDIPQVEPEVTEHTIHSDWCAKCQKRVEPKVPDALPGATLGNRVLVLSAWLHYYNAVACARRQMCLVHLLRDLEQVDKYKRPGEDWPAFAKKLRRLVADAIRLWYRQDALTAEQYQSRRDRLHKRLALLIESPWEDKQAKRLVKRLRRHCEDLFTFLDQPGVPFGNNHAKRIIRPLFIFDGGSYGNRSQRGADCQAVLMSVFRTLKQRGHDPVSTICNAIATYLKTGQLPPLPANIVSNG